MILSVDPGANQGALVLWDGGYPVESFIVSGGWGGLPEWIDAFRANLSAVVIERMLPYPKSSKVSLMTLSEGVGMIKGVLLPHTFPIIEVTASKWQSFYLSPPDRDNLLKTLSKRKAAKLWKGWLHTTARELYPKENIALEEADAYLIGHYYHETCK